MASREEKMASQEDVDLGISNSGLRAGEEEEEDENRENSFLENLGSGCLQFIDPQSPGDEYDETLAIPESMHLSGLIGANAALKNEDEEDQHNRQYELPYSNVYNPPVRFNAMQRKGVPIHVEITDYERQLTSHFLNPNLYTIQLTHGNSVWHIKKRYKDFAGLHQQLRMFRTSLKIPLPTKNHREMRTSFRNNPNISVSSNSTAHSTATGNTKKKKKKGALPRFPNKPDALVPFESIPIRIRQLEKYLYNLLSISLYREHHDTINFLEVSHMSFISSLGEKGKEGRLKKRTGSTHPGSTGCNLLGCLHCGCCVRCCYICSDICGKWRDRWLFVKETYFGLIRPKDGAVRTVVLFDQGFDISSGMYNMGLRNGIQITNDTRYLVLKCGTRRVAKEWTNYFKEVANNSARDFTMPNPHQSYAPVRSGALASWFVDGASYMSAVADAMEGAVEEIFIADWWLSPEIYMKRPALDGHYWRLDQILKRKAEQGIKIFILLYKEVEMALGINSYYSKQRLVSLHENVKVLRHPDHARAGVFFWAHHEKLVIVDQTYAFVGGIDLCYGRWDDHQHRLTDLGSIFPKQRDSTIKKTSTIIDYSILTLMNQSKDILSATSGTIKKPAENVATIKESLGAVQEALETAQDALGNVQDTLGDRPFNQVVHESTRIIQSTSGTTPITEIIHESTRIIRKSSENLHLDPNDLRKVERFADLLLEAAGDDVDVGDGLRKIREAGENNFPVPSVVVLSPESPEQTNKENSKKSEEEIQKSSKEVTFMEKHLVEPKLPEEDLKNSEKENKIEPPASCSANLIASEKSQIIAENARPHPSILKSIVKSPGPSKKKEEPEPITENTKRNTPEMERKNVLGKLREIKTKGRDIMHRMTATITMEPTPAQPEEKIEIPEKDETDQIELDGQAKLWVGKDYTNFILKDFIELDSPFNDLVDRTTTPRMPWHDIATVVVGHTARDAARHFIQRWNTVKLEKARENISYPYLMPKSYTDMRIDDNFFPKKKIRLSRVTCQMLRSVSQWSCGYIEPENCEQSIHEAYVQTITKAQHYIYIENQFFISTSYQDQNVKNQITELLSKRILRAFREKKPFRVFVVMPLLPGFEGDVGGATGNSLRIITHWNYASISRGKHSLIQKLLDAGIKNPREFVSFHSLRNHTVLDGKLVTELIYVHSKLLIADDKTVICGSANINDRSLLGKRDSEVAVLITDESFEDGKMNGESYPCGIFAGSLRKQLFREHLGLLNQKHAAHIDITDPICASFWHDQWLKISQRNTELYDEIFRCIPNNYVTTLAYMKRYQDEMPSLCRTDTALADEKITEIRGFLVDLPLKFLKDENLIPFGATKEGIMPTSLWT